MQLTNAPAWPRRQGTDLDHRGQALALLISLLAHTLLLSLSFGGAAFGLPGLSLPWAERRVTAPDLRVRLVATPGNLTAPAPVPAPAAHPLPPVPVMAAVGPRSEPTPPLAPAQTTAPVAVATPPEPLSESVPLSAPETPPVPTVAIKPSAESAAIQAPPPPEPGVPQTTPSTPPPRPTELAMLDHAEQTAQAREAARQQASHADIARLASQRREAEQPFTIRQEEARQEEARREAVRTDAARLAAERQEAERQATAQQETAQREAARQAAARAQAVQQETGRQQAAQAEATRREAERQEVARQAAAQQEAARQQAAQAETTRLETERQEAARQAAAQQEAARQQAAQAEATRREAERQEAARQAAARQDADRLAAAQAAAARLAAQRQAELRDHEVEREERLRAIGRQLNEEADRREAAARQSPQHSPLRRVRLFGRADPNQELVEYAEAFARKIQMNMSIDLVREAARQPHTQPVVTVAIRSDGTVESVTIVRSSGVAAIDAAVPRIVHSQANYAAFAPVLAREYDVIEIRRTWHFDAAVRLH